MYKKVVCKMDDFVETSNKIYAEGFYRLHSWQTFLQQSTDTRIHIPTEMVIAIFERK